MGVGIGDEVSDSLGDGLGGGEVVLAAVGAVVVGAGADDTGGVVEAAGAGSVAFGLRDSTLVFSRFTWSSRSCLLAPSLIDCTVLLTSAS